MRKGSWFLLFFVIFLSSLSLNISAKEELKAVLSASEIHPGEFVWVQLTSTTAQKVSVMLLGETTYLQRAADIWRGMLPVSYNTTPGEYVITINITTDGGSFTQNLPIRVEQRAFPEDRIRVPEKMRQETLGTANVNDDTQKVQKAREGPLANPLPPLWNGAFSWPVVGRITTDFGYQRYVNDKPNGRHSGLDIAAPNGTPVTAVNSGYVILAESLHWTGQTIIIYHGMNLFTSYSHLSAMLVRPGDKVEKDAVIGAVGSTGLATGSHLHLTFRLGETAVDPALFLGRELIP